MTVNKYVSFRGVTPEGTSLDTVTVTAYKPDGTLVFQEEFDLGEPGATPRWVVIPSGEYRFNVRSDGYRAENFLFAYTIPEVGPGSSPDDLFEILTHLVATTPTPQTLPCKVFGWVRVPGPGNQPGGPMGSVGTTYDDGPTTHSQTVRHIVWFEELSTVDGEVPSLQRKSRTRVAYDRNGYFEALLRPQTRYRVIRPDITGYVMIDSPAAGVEAEFETVVDPTGSLSLQELT